MAENFDPSAIVAAIRRDAASGIIRPTGEATPPNLAPIGADPGAEDREAGQALAEEVRGMADAHLIGKPGVTGSGVERSDAWPGDYIRQDRSGVPL